MEFNIRDTRSREFFVIDDHFLDIYSAILGVYCTVVYMSLCRHADRQQKAFPAQQTIARECGISERIVRKSVKTLIDWNVIVAQREKGKTGRWERTIYCLRDKKEWSKPEAYGAGGYHGLNQMEKEVENHRHVVPVVSTGMGEQNPPAWDNSVHRHQDPTKVLTTTEVHKQQQKYSVSAPEKGADYQTFVDHLLATYKAGPGKGMPYPFNGQDGRQIKRLLGLYGLETLLALWDEFLACEWNWYDKGNKLVSVPRNLKVFESKVPNLLENGAFKRRILEQPPADPEAAAAVAGLVKSIGKKIKEVV